MTLSVWHDKEPKRPKSKERKQFDIVIVGAGLLGCGCAYWLSRGNKYKLALVESGQLAGGASGRNAGFVLRGIQGYYNTAVEKYGRENARAIFAFTQENQNMLRQFAVENGNTFALEECGSYLLACSLEELEDLNQSAQLLEEDGFAIEYLKGDPLERDYYGALLNKSDFGIHPVNLAEALIEASRVSLFQNESVNRIEPEQSGGRLTVETTGLVLECDRVLVTTNAYTPLLDKWFLDKLKIARGQILVTQPLRKRVLDRLCYANYGWEYFRQLADNRLLLGGCRQHFLSEEQGYADLITKPVQNALENYLKDRFSDIAGVPIDYRFSGIMAFAPDGLPIVGELKRTPGVFYAVACNGHGLSYGLNMSKLLVDVAMNADSPGIFSSDRPELQGKMAVAAKRDQGP